MARHATIRGARAARRAVAAAAARARSRGFLDAFLGKLAEAGAEPARARLRESFAAVSDTDEMPVVTAEPAGDGAWRVTASGRDVLFLEFGTGLSQGRPSRHGAEHGMVPGSWSATHGRYLTDPAKLARYGGRWPHKGRLRKGNPPADAMPAAAERARQRQVIEEAFRQAWGEA